MSQSFELDLGMASRIVIPEVIQVQKRGVRRRSSFRECLSMALGALGMLDRSSGVLALNAEFNGRSTALVLIENVKFVRDMDGYTVLKEINNENESR